MPRFRGERRMRSDQRRAVDDIVGRAEGVATLVRADDGSVWIYDEVRHAPVPGTRRFRVDPTGDVDPPEFLRYRITG